MRNRTEHTPMQNIKSIKHSFELNEFCLLLVKRGAEVPSFSF